MDTPLGALVSFGRRLASIPRDGHVADAGAVALSTAFEGTLAAVVIWSDGARPETGWSGHAPSPFEGDDPERFGLEALRRRLTAAGSTVLRSASLGRDHVGSDHEGFILIGWDADVQAAQRWRESEAIDLAALQLRAVIKQSEFEKQLAATQHTVVELAEQLAGTGHLHLLGEMASGVAHDFNNALTTILGTTEWLLQHAVLEDDAREDLTHIRTAATDASVYADRLQRGACQIPARTSGPSATSADGAESVQAPHSELVNLSSIATHMRALSRPRWSQLVEQGVPIEVVVDAPPVSPIRGRAAEIRELLWNLVFNAIDAMKDKGGRLTLRVRESDGHVRLSVSDQGGGIPDGVKPHIFDPFFTTKGKRGNGLGLSMCSRIAHQHGGTLEVESEPGKGSAFTLILPAVERRTPAPTIEGDPGVAHRPTRRVLLIDDQPDVLESVSDMLKALGHEVTVAADGESGLRLMQSATFDVVLTDLRMPDIDGLDVARGARDLQPGIPVVLLTGWGALFEDAEPDAVSVVLPKPPTLASLSEAITQAGSGIAA